MNRRILPPGTSAAGGSFKRISLKVAPDVPEDIPQNDDEAEREQRRRVSGKFGQLAGLQVSLGGIAELSASELVAQYANCMRLSAENKINHKNAFNLPLIDCMKLLLKKKDEQMNNFQVVGCTLDASAKIYASRVDRVHMDGMSFAKDLGGRARDSPASRNNENGDEELDDENIERIKKKKYKKQRILSKDVSKINISLEVTEPDPTYVVLSKQFSNCQPSFISFLPRLNIVDDSCKIFMDMKRPFLVKEEGIIYEDTDVELEYSNGMNGQIVGPPFRDILTRESEDIDYDSLLNVSTLDDSLDEDDAIDNHMDDDNDPFTEPLEQNTILNGDIVSGNGIPGAEDGLHWKSVSEPGGTTRFECQATRGREQVVDLQEAILKQVKEGGNLEYTYMNLDRILFAGPTHWGRLPVSKGKETSAVGEGNKKREKKITNLDFIHVEEVEMPPIRSFCTLTRAYLDNNWSMDKVTNPTDLHLDTKTLLRYFNRPLCGISLSGQNDKAIPPEEEDADVNDYDYDNLNDSQQFCPAPLLEPETSGNTSCSERLEPSVDVHSCEQSESAADGWAMVDPPNKVARIAVPYAQHAKKVDMKVLKTAIWTILCEANQTMEVDSSLAPKSKRMNNNIKNKNSSQVATMHGQIKFSLMDRRVMNIVPADMVPELTMPLLFTALLHLANEQVLTLQGLEDHSDIIISQDSGAENFVRHLQLREFV